MPIDSSNSPHTKGRNYRYEIDDYYSLGILLCDLLFPDEPYPKSEFDLQLLPNINDHIYKILYYLLFHPEGVNLVTIHELAVKFTESQFEESVLSVQWHKSIRKYSWKVVRILLTGNKYFYRISKMNVIYLLHIKK